MRHVLYNGSRNTDDQNKKNYWEKIFTNIPQKLMAEFRLSDDKEELKKATKRVTASHGTEHQGKPVVSSIEPTVYDTAEEMPEYPGGQRALEKYLKYPLPADYNGKEGHVILSFVIEQDVTISHITVLKSLSEKTDKQAIELIRNMPRWTPGKRNGQMVRVRYLAPVTFHKQA